MKVLVTGGAGYIGSVVVPLLVARGHQVVVIDKLSFGNNIKHVLDQIEFHEMDALEIDPKFLEGIDAVIHLAGLSNDPMANFRPRDNFIQNTALTSLLVYLCKKAGVKRFIFAGTCSVYGFSDKKIMDESSALAPTFPYGISKVQSEFAIMSARDSNFNPVILRQATVYGAAPRMRFDLVVNTMTKYGVLDHKITVNNPDLWRPLIHINDLARVYANILERPDASGIYNVATGNYTILDIAKTVQATLTEKGISAEIDVKNEDDARSYQVDCSRAIKELDLEKRHDIDGAVHEILGVFKDEKNPEWKNPKYINAEVYRARILKDKDHYAQWKEYVKKIDPNTDAITWREWPQEGP
jgi:nucleoside-diphosphate-sugar epimerase